MFCLLYNLGVARAWLDAMCAMRCAPVRFFKLFWAFQALCDGMCVMKSTWCFRLAVQYFEML